MRRRLEDGVHPKAANADALLNRCVSIDLEIDPKTNRIQSFAGVRADAEDACVFKRGNLDEALDALDRFAGPADFVLGHNFITFDARHLEATKRDLRILKKPVIDTLWINPLALPIRLSAGLFHRVQLSRNTSQYGFLIRVCELVFHALLPEGSGSEA